MKGRGEKLDLLRLHTVLAWIAYLLGVLVSGYVAVAGIDHIFGVSMIVTYAIHGSWMLHVWVKMPENPARSIVGIIFTVALLLSLNFIVLCMIGLIIDVVANGTEGLNVEAYISGLLPGWAVFAVASYMLAGRLSDLGRRIDQSNSRATWLLWASNLCFLIGAPLLWRQVVLIRSCPALENVR